MDMSNCGIMEFSSQLFYNLPNCLHLILSNNNLSLLNSSFSELFLADNKIKRLDIGQNSLSDISQTALMSLKNLKQLYLNNNVLLGIPKYFMELSKSLTALDLTTNNISCCSNIEQIMVLTETNFSLLECYYKDNNTMFSNNNNNNNNNNNDLQIRCLPEQKPVYNNNNNNNNLWIIVGSVIGVIVVLLIAALIGFLIYKKKQKHKNLLGGLTATEFVNYEPNPKDKGNIHKNDDNYQNTEDSHYVDSYKDLYEATGEKYGDIDDYCGKESVVGDYALAESMVGEYDLAQSMVGEYALVNNEGPLEVTKQNSFGQMTEYSNVEIDYHSDSIESNPTGNLLNENSNENEYEQPQEIHHLNDDSISITCYNDDDVAVDNSE
eukprot:Pgem_evm1s16652